MARAAGSSILVAGAINTDLVATMERAPEAGETITGHGFAIHGGGKGANQAVAAARSGASVTLVGAVGNDDFGRARLADLTRHNVVTRWVKTQDMAPSGVALILVEEGGENRIAYVPGATQTVPADHGRAAMLATRPAILLATNELPLSVLEAMFAEARRDGCQVILNATPEPATAESLLGDLSVLIVNAVEAGVLLGTNRRLEPEDAAPEVRAQHSIDVVIVTAGKQGAFVAGADGAVHHVAAPRVDVVDTTGAGDTFCGPLLLRSRAGGR
jgi:ribokinase